MWTILVPDVQTWRLRGRRHMIRPRKVPTWSRPSRRGYLRNSVVTPLEQLRQV